MMNTFKKINLSIFIDIGKKQNVHPLICKNLKLLNLQIKKLMKL